ncbi:hypothetical protein [Streptomyces sp. NPDC005209]|uniref:hypothetical protein n=1 Tax=Streptomyces sp. NPDC005209 TaxID=3156715 RepID=UPI00339F9423
MRLPRTGRSSAAVIVERLTFNGAIIQTGTDSYRLAHTKPRPNAPPSADQSGATGSRDG